MERWNLSTSVGLRPARTVRFGGDRQCFAGVAPEVRPVGAAVVGQYPFNGDAAVGKPVSGPAQDCNSGHGGLVVVDLGVGDSGMVIDDGMRERISELRVATDVA